ncbi:hypothetical protein GJAV_G00137070 [Gymnothorax javanicus]|nr:hypothetical protein GJAV_G00137070 [Gymnothorax javanicus]
MVPDRNIFLLLGETSLGSKRLPDDRPLSPASSYESMTSDVRSMQDYNLSDDSEEVPLSTTKIQLDRPDSPASSCSEASDASSRGPVKPFCMEPRSQPRKRVGSNHSTQWVPLDKAGVKDLLGITEERHPAMNLSFLSEALNDTLQNLKEDELRYFKKILVDRYPQIFESSLLQHAVPELVGKMLERCDMEGSLKIAVLTLEDMRLQERAKSLQGKCKRNEMQYDLKASLKEKYSSIYEGLPRIGSPDLLKKIYTELVIANDGHGSIKTQHEVRHLGEVVPKRKDFRLINGRDVFTPLGGYTEHQRFLLMNGMPGSGKSVCVQRFILDWAEGEGHQDMFFVFPIPFRELNSLKSEKYSLIQLIHHFFPEMKGLDSICCLDGYKVLFIFDGLDECEFSLDFFHTEMWCSQTQPTSMDMLLINLFKGNIVSSGHIWITSRPAAAKRISAYCVHRVAEVQGFNDTQKEEYFKNTIGDQTLANRIINHVRSEKSLYIMCHLPIFCWTLSNLFQRAICMPNGEIPKTLTDAFTWFLLIQLNIKVQKYHGKELSEMFEKEREFLMILGKLALEMLEQDQLVLNEDQWEKTGISREEAMRSGLCTELFKEQFALYREKMFCFMHLTIQEYLAALYVFMSFKNRSKNVLEKSHSSKLRIFKTTLLDVHKSAVDRALQCRDGQFDMFLRFLLGLSLESNQEHLRGIVMKVGEGTHLEKTAQYIRSKMKENHSEERLKNLAHCLIEINHFTP